MEREWYVCESCGYSGDPVLAVNYNRETMPGKVYGLILSCPDHGEWVAKTMPDGTIRTDRSQQAGEKLRLLK